jgi:hypothetical protein
MQTAESEGLPERGFMDRARTRGPHCSRSARPGSTREEEGFIPEGAHLKQG